MAEWSVVIAGVLLAGLVAVPLGVLLVVRARLAAPPAPPAAPPSVRQPPAPPALVEVRADLFETPVSEVPSPDDEGSADSSEDEDDIPTTLYRRDDDPEIEAFLSESPGAQATR